MPFLHTMVNDVTIFHSFVRSFDLPSQFASVSDYHYRNRTSMSPVLQMPEQFVVACNMLILWRNMNEWTWDI